MNPIRVPAVTADALPADAVLLDCREPDEWQAGHADGAVHVPMNSVPQQLQHAPGELASGRPIVVVCKMGGRSAQVAAWLIAHGYDASNLDGGMYAWVAAGRPIVSENGRSPQIV